MKTYTLHLPDEIAERVQAYAQTQQELPEEALMRLIEARFTPSHSSTQNTDEDTIEAYPDPWAGFRARFTADVPDLFTHHDAYLAESVLDPHDHSDERGEVEKKQG